MRSFIRLVDGVSERTGKIFCWTCIALILVLCYEVVSRYLFNNPTFWGMDIPKMLGGVFVSMGVAYTLLHRKHVRCDILYARMPSKTKAAIDVVGAAFLFLPLLAALVYVSGKSMLLSWIYAERWVQTAWFPPSGPIMTVIFIGLCIFFLQAVAMFIRDLLTIMGKEL